jgi:putative flippase GtrA
LIHRLTEKLGPELVKYIVSGLASGASMYFSGFLIKGAGATALTASALAALISFAVSYLLQRFWVFSASNVNSLKSAFKFAVVTSITWTIGLSWVWLADTQIELKYEWTQLVLVIIVSGLNFSINKLWTFKN